MALHGVDISGWDRGIDTKSLTADFVIVKSTEGIQGTIYNPDYRSMADRAADSGKLIGFYHYANGGDPVAEADCFYESIKSYTGKAIACLDWEEQGNRTFESGQDVAWCLKFMNRIREKMGCLPLLYTSKGVCNEYDWSPIVQSKYPLWGAEYAYNNYIYQDYEPNPWQSKAKWGAWVDVDLFQYGYVNPFPNNGGISSGLDADILMKGNAETWAKWCGGKEAPSIITSINRVKISIADIAATIHYDMCVDPANGYSQSPYRWGEDGLGIKTIAIHGRKYSYDRGSYDCSSSVITAWKAALAGTPYAGALSGATYTGDMYRVFINSGLFYADLQPAKRGDIYLNEGVHTAMCQDGGKDNVLGYDALSEFNRNENHGATNGQPGDQDGYESVIRGYYNDDWNWVLHYNGKADFYADESTDISFEENTGNQEADEMICIIHPDEANYMVYMTGTKIMKLSSQKQQDAIKQIYKKTHNGKDIPMFAIGTKANPVFKFIEELFDREEAEQNAKIQKMIQGEISKIKMPTFPTIDNEDIAMKVVEKLALNNIPDDKSLLDKLGFHK